MRSTDNLSTKTYIDLTVGISLFNYTCSMNPGPEVINFAYAKLNWAWNLSCS